MYNFESSDIDWFCFINGCPIHVASNGGELPNNLYSDEDLISAFNAARAIEPIHKWNINQEFINSRHESYSYINGIEENEQDDFLLPEFIERKEYGNLSSEHIAYSWSFIEMAKRGFFSFDRVEGNRYRLIAFPNNYSSSLENSKKISFPTHSLVYHYYYYYWHEGILKVMSMTRHLFTKQEFSFGLDEDVDLIDLINSIIAPEQLYV